MVLWKKESTGADACYIDLLPSNQVNSLGFKTHKTIFGNIQKNEMASITHRKTGNESFKAGKWIEAIEHYNKSIRFAINESEQLALCYANRSACFLYLKMYDKCLADIELAKNANYPEHLMHKLNERKSACEKEMKESVEVDKKVTSELSFSPNTKFPGMADILEVRSNDEFGKHVVAKCDIDVGKIVMVEDAFVTAIDYNCETVCKTCAKHITNFIPCPNCADVMFCSAKCLESNNLHKEFCGALYNRWPRDALIVESILAVAPAFPNADSLMKFVKCALATRDLDSPECESDSQLKYRLFLKLLALPRDINAMRQQIFDVYNSLLDIPHIAKFFHSKQAKRFLMHLIWQHLCILDTNRFGTFHPNGSEYITIVGLCSSLFNHSCVPNTLHMRGNKMIARVQRPVKKGEQLFINYFQGRDNAPSGQRNLGFQCKCSKCIPCWKLEDRIRIQSDPNFYSFASVEDSDFKIYKKRSNFKAKFENLLSKYGRLPWSSEFETIEIGYRMCVAEELSMVDYCSAIKR